MNGVHENRPMLFWLEKMTTDVFPILRHSRDELSAMELDIDNITDGAIARQIYHDPLLMTNVLRKVANIPRRELAGEVTTIDRAVMMLGMQPFFRWVKTLPVLEERLKDKVPILQRLQVVLACNYHAAHQAWQWSMLRKDINADEVFVAALLHNRLIWAGWLLMPGEMLLIEQFMRREQMDFATAFFRHTDYRFDEVMIELAKKWRLPGLYVDFHLGHNAVRAQGVTLAQTLSELTQRGWWQPAVEKQLAQIAEWLHQPADDITAKIHAYSAQAARHTTGWYGSATPAAAWLPMLPGAWPDEAKRTVSVSRVTSVSDTSDRKTQAASASKTVVTPVPIPPLVTPEKVAATSTTATAALASTAATAAAPAPPTTAIATATTAATSSSDAPNHVLHPEVVARIIADIKAHMDGSFDIEQLMSLVLKAMHDGLALDRVVFCLLTADQTMKARFTLGIENSAPMKNLNFSLQEKHLFAQLMNKMQAAWFRKESAQKLSPFLLPKIRAQIGRGEFMAMSVHVHGKPVGFFYADYGDRGQMDQIVYAGFKQLCTLTAESMAHLSKKPKD